MRRTDIYVRKADIFVVVLKETFLGITIQTENVTRLPRDVEANDLGAVVLSALDNYQDNVAELPDRRDYPKPLLHALGYKSLAAFCRGTSNVGVAVSDSTAQVVPTKPYGRSGYLAFTMDEYPGGGVLECHLEPKELGEAILSRALLCIPHRE